MGRPDRNADRVRRGAHSICKLFALLAVGATTLCSPVLAEEQAAAAPDCPLTRVASLQISVLSDGSLGVPAMLAGKEQMLALGISEEYSYLYKSYVEAENFPTEPVPQRAARLVIGNTHVRLLATVPDINIGMIGGRKQFAEVDKPASGGTVGKLALDVLGGFDMEIDLDRMRLNLFSQDHCAGGGVVYWADDYAELPLKTDAIGHPSVTMELDGAKLTVTFSAAPGPGRMVMAATKRLFNIDKTTPGIKYIGTSTGGDMYRYPFKQLTIEGVTVGNPEIDIEPDMRECRPVGSAPCYGASELELGIKEMRRLHLYFAFKEKMLYVTAATPRKAKDQPWPAPVQLAKPK